MTDTLTERSVRRMAKNKNSKNKCNTVQTLSACYTLCENVYYKIVHTSPKRSISI